MLLVIFVVESLVFGNLLCPMKRPCEAPGPPLWLIGAIWRALPSTAKLACMGRHWQGRPAPVRTEILKAGLVAMGGPAAHGHGAGVPAAYARCGFVLSRLITAMQHGGIQQCPYLWRAITDICSRARATQPNRALVQCSPWSPHPQCETSHERRLGVIPNATRNNK